MPKVKLIVEGGSMKPGPAVAQQLGPMGINMGKVITDVNEATKGYKGIKVPVELDVNAKTKTYTIAVFSPPVAEMIKKELGIEKGSGLAGKSYVGNIAFERVLSVAKSKQADLLSRDLKAAVKLVVGTCYALGVLIDSKTPKEITGMINSGEFDSAIKSEKTEVSPEKKKELETFFKEVSSEQERKAKAAQDAKAAEEAAAAAAAPAATAAAPAPGAKAPAGKAPAAAAKAPAKAPAKKK